MSSRTYLVTGASRGIGFATSTLLARRGHRVIGLARHAQGIDFPGELIACDLADIERTARRSPASARRTRSTAS